MALDLRYLAGFFDGEGSVGLYYDRTHKTWFARIEICQNYNKASEFMFKEWAKEYQGKVYVQRKAGAVPTVRFVLTRDRTIIRFIRHVREYTRLKTQQILVLDEWLQTRTFSFRVSQLLKSLKRVQ